MCAELPRRSLAAYAVQQNCVYFPQVIIEKHSSVDVASILEVNHVKPQCYVIDSCDCAYLCICHLFTWILLTVKCMYVLFSSH